MALQMDIDKSYGDFHLKVRIDSTSKRIGILGASGCGKSMTLKSLAGIETPDRGRISVEGRVVYDSARKINWRPQKRKIGYLFQNYALFPNMSVETNIGAGLKKWGKEEKRQRVAEMIRKFRLEGLEKRLPGELSGGQQQRVALARIMACQPEMILLDEPFSALDVYLRDRLQQEMEEMLADYPGTVILVSHSRDEIYRFSEELLVMDQGEIIRSGGVREIFSNPVRVEAARISGCKNIVEIRRRDAHTLEIPEWETVLTLEREVPEERKANCIAARVGSIAELPFERKYFIKGAADGAEEICWFVQRELLQVLEKRGMPDYLQMPEKSILLLK